MPVRVSQAQPPPPSSTSSSITSTYPHQRRASPASIRGGEESSSVDSRQRRRLHKSPPEQHNIMTRSNSSLRSAAKEPSSPQKPPRSAGRDRGTTITAARQPRNPTATVKSSSVSSTSSSTVSTTRGYLQPPEPTSNVTTFYAFGQNADDMDNGDFEFSPSVNLEDVHRSIITDDVDPELSMFPIPGRVGGINNVGSGSSSHSGPTASVIRRPSVSRFAASNTQQEQQQPYRQRRISNVGGPGARAPGDVRTNQQRRRPSVAGSLNSTSSLTPPIPGKEYFAGSGHSRNAPDARIQVANNVNRNAKAKSLQPPPRSHVTTSTPLKPTLTPEHARPGSFVLAPPKSPSSPSVRVHKSALPTPGANRRISTIPHASGLGARTISPTDARRLKRLSTIRTPPPPSAEPVAQRSTEASPSMIPRKSVTPSSSTNTPEPTRKSYSSGLSNASGTPSARTSTGSLQPRLSQNLSASRLPTAKVSRQSSEEDEIPPVPPLPKSLVSPSLTGSEFSATNSRESILPPDPPPHREYPPPHRDLPTPHHEMHVSHHRELPIPHKEPSTSHRELPTPHTENHRDLHPTTPHRELPLAPQREPHRELPITPHRELPKPPKALPTPHRNSTPVMRHQEVEIPQQEVTSTASTRRKRGMTLGYNMTTQPHHALEPKASTSQLNKKNLAPLRLPPLNLLPLSTPTINRVNALGNTSDAEDFTPPRRHGMNTPSTPMTASKVSFFGRRSATEAPMSTHQRSTSSINHIPPNSSPSSASFRAGSSTSSIVPTSTTARYGRQTISPYVPPVLPRQSLDYGQGYDGNPVPEVKGSSKILGLPLPREKSKHKAKEEAPATSGQQTPDTPPSASSIRRKLSLSWKRGTKTSHAAAERDAEYPPPKYDGMPPPRVPASATWANPASVSTPSPSKASHSRRKSIVGVIGHDRTKSEGWNNITGSPRSQPNTERADETVVPAQHYQAYQPPAPMGPPPPPAKSTSHNSILSPVHKMLSSKSSLGQMRRSQPAASPQDPSLDADDLIAEEEMRKLASKRRNLEVATQQLEELKGRAVPKQRMSNAEAMRMVPLNIFERGEIVDFKDIYFCGAEGAKKFVGDPNSQNGLNYGYDDERGDYTIVKGDHLAYRYEIVDILGKGSFGQVVRCVDHKTGGLVAIKIIRNKKRFHQQALVEVNILQKLKEWDPHKKHSLISFTQSFYFRGHLCISTELLGMNLYEFIKSNDFRGFSLRLIRRFTKQLISSLILLKSHKVIHCDLKPENVLLAAPNKGEIKVIDFGSSCFENEKVYTYIQSRFYRSPEVILGMTYGLPIDMWSLGCILAELYTGYPIFPGENEQEQLACIMEVFGPPEKHLIEKSTRKKLFFDSFGKPRVIVSSKGRRRRPSSKTLSQALKCDDEAFLDFIARCLRWDPEKRLKPDEATHHDFLTGRKTSARSRGNSGPSSDTTTVARSKFGSGSGYSISGSRPLPEPPATTSKISSKPSAHLSFNSQSPSKSYGTLNTSTASAALSNVNGTGTTNHLKRHSTVSSTASTGKRNSSGVAASSNLPRVAGVVASSSTRSASGKLPTPPISNGRR